MCIGTVTWKYKKPFTKRHPNCLAARSGVRWDSLCVLIFNERMGQVAMHSRIEAGKFRRSLGAAGLSVPVLSIPVARSPCAPLWVCVRSTPGTTTTTYCRKKMLQEPTSGMPSIRHLLSLLIL